MRDPIVKLKNISLVRLVRRIANDSSNIILTYHAEDRMDERGIDFQDVINVLKSGELVDLRTDKNGKEILKFVGGEHYRKIGVISIVIKNNQRIKIITVEWEDL